MFVRGTSKDDIYITLLKRISDNKSIYLRDVYQLNQWVWHKKFGHASLILLNNLKSCNLVIGLPYIKYEIDKICSEYAKGKHVKSSFKPKKSVMSTNRPFEVVHIGSHKCVKSKLSHVYVLWLMIFLDLPGLYS